MPDNGNRPRLPRSRSGRGLLERIATGVVAAVAFVIAATAAVFLFSIFFALIAALSAVVMVRVWWLRRKFRQAFDRATSESPGHRQAQAQDGNVLEGEYEVVRERKEEADKR